MAWVAWVTWVAGCHRDGDPTPAAIDLVSPLGPGEVRAGVISDEAALFGGISAEGRAGDLKLYNDRVQYVVQAIRPGNYYLVEGGGVIDADVVRPEGVVGRDVVEEWSAMFGLGRVTVPETIEVVNDGTNGEPARVRVTGYATGLGLIEGAIEIPGFIDPLGLELVTEYVLAPDSWLLEVTSTASATTDPASLAIADIIIGADEVTSPWVPGTGLEGSSAARAWSGYMGDNDDVAVAIGAPAGETLSVTGYDLLTELASMVVGAGPSVSLAPGESATWTRMYGVGPDLATLSGAIQQARGEPTEPFAGLVTAADGPVAGARVVVDVDGAPYTVAVTAEDGTFAADVPEGSVATGLAIGRGTGLSTDLPPGAPPGSPYAADRVRTMGLDALASGAPEVPQAVGRGVGSPADPFTLGVPAKLAVHADDGLPFTVRVAFVAPDLAVDPARYPPRPDGLAAAGWARDGAIELAVEPGTYDVVVHRGIRFEALSTQVTLTAGETRDLAVELPAAFDHAGWILGDPHSHASPSSDGAVSMEDRLVVAAGVGVQVHFGTDHDHLADYRPLLAPLGLEGVLKSVVADEVSPPLRGHFNIYPVEPDPTLPDGGAWEWWTDVPLTTEGMVDTLRSRHGDDFVLQSNHPTSSGLASSSGWSEGRVVRADFWTDRIEAVEVLNSGDWASFLPFWYDLVSRGRAVTPVGVSDSHSHFGGNVGWSATWLHAGDDPAAVTDDAIGLAIRSGAVEVTRGPFLAIDPLPGTSLAPGAQITVTARSASWVQVDRLKLVRDGDEALAEVVDGTTATFTLDPTVDAWYAVIAEGDTPMTPVTSDTPWALAGPFKVDVGGDGWDPPLPPLTVE